MSSLGWAAEFPLTLLDTSVILRVDTVSVAEGVGRLLAPFVADHVREVAAKNCLALVNGDHTGIEQRGGLLLAYRDGKIVGAGDRWSEPLLAMLTALNRQAIEEYTGFALHAGVVALGDRAIAFPADSGGGKSTLTAACLQVGFRYVSDESLCLDIDTGSVVPYPKPLGLSLWSRQQLRLHDDALAFPAGRAEGMATPEDLGSVAVTRTVRLQHIVLPTYGEAMGLAEVPAHEAMEALLVMSFNHYKYGARAFHLAAEVANRVRVWRLGYDHPTEAAELLEEHFG